MGEELRPLSFEPGRDRTRDQPAPFAIGPYYYDQRFRVADDAGVLTQLMETLDGTNELDAYQWGQWYSVALGFEPDLIVELGRARGNSTALFCQAAYRLGTTRVVSVCRSGEWAASTSKRIAPLVDPEWFANLDARMVDITAADYRSIIGDHRRVLVLWDAHGFEIANVVLGEILPLLADRDHLVLLHDISDNRYVFTGRSYNGQPLWKAQRSPHRSGSATARVNIGWMNSEQDQVIAIADFATRNDLEIGSADHEYAEFFGADPRRAEEMGRLLGGLFSATAHWAFLSLSGKAGPFHFPAATPASITEACPIVTDPLPPVITLEPRPWWYASTFAWRPLRVPPPDAQPWVEWRLRVEGGPVGVSLLTADETEFVDQKVAAPSADPVIVRLRVSDVNRHGRLVVHTWDAPVAARVRIEALSLVW